MVQGFLHLAGRVVQFLGVAAHEGVVVDAGAAAACALHVGVSQGNHEGGVVAERLSEAFDDHIDVFAFGDGLQAHHDIGGVGIGSGAAAYGGGEASHRGIGQNDGVQFLHGAGQGVEGNGFLGLGENADTAAVDGREVACGHQGGQPPCGRNERKRSQEGEELVPHDAVETARIEGKQA